MQRSFGPRMQRLELCRLHLIFPDAHFEGLRHEGTDLISGTRRHRIGERVRLDELHNSPSAIPHYATNFFVDSKSASRACQLRSDLLPKIRRLLSPIRAIETSAKYGRGESLRETERVGRDPFWLFRASSVSGLLLFDSASS